MSPDGRGVVFEVTNDLVIESMFQRPLSTEPAEEEFFFVRSDGTGLRRLRPPSGDAFFTILTGPPPLNASGPEGGALSQPQPRWAEAR